MNSGSNIALKFNSGLSISASDLIEKIKEGIYNKSGIGSFEPSSEWQDKMERKEERQIIIEEHVKEYSDKGSLSLSVLTSILGDLDIYLKGESAERGWTLFEP